MYPRCDAFEVETIARFLMIGFVMDVWSDLKLRNVMFCNNKGVLNFYRWVNC